jgi:eukaryotic-like serine/threonine-protein kinase
MSFREPKLPAKFGRYLLVRRLAAGGMGQVYLGMVESFGSFRKLLAVKFLHNHLALDGKFVEMFLDEARLAACLSHPNVVHTFDLGHHDGTFFIAMEYVHGMSLVSALAKGPLPLPVAMSVAMGAVGGLSFAHHATDELGKPLNIVHRDIAPKNILVSFGGDVKLADFGIARAADQGHFTQTGEVKGTMNYMPLEQLKGEATDTRSDIYAMGATLYQVFANRPLFNMEELKHFDLIREDVRKDIKHPRELRPDIPEALNDVILRAVALDPADRFATGKELLRALQTVSDSMELKPGPELIGDWLADCFPKVAKQPPLGADDLSSLGTEANVAPTGGPPTGGHTPVVASGDALPTKDLAPLEMMVAPTISHVEQPPPHGRNKLAVGVVLVAAIAATVAAASYFAGRNEVPVKRALTSTKAPHQPMATPATKPSVAKNAVPATSPSIAAPTTLPSGNTPAQEKEFVSILVNSVPSGAAVLVDGAHVGETPFVYRRQRDEKKKVKVLLALARHKSVSRVLPLKANTKMDVVLRKLRRRRSTRVTRPPPPKKVQPVPLGDLKRPSGS